jgi:ABC-type transport system involved in multi-copper enzyme maturation permease subunit
MNRRLRKEFRGLLVPWASTLAAALLMPAQILPNGTWAHAVPGWAKQIVDFLSGLSPVLFFSGIIAMAAGTFGMEFQHRTTAVWLSQPVSRARLWKDKMLVLAAAVIISSLAAVIALVVIQRLIGTQWAPNQDSKEVLIEGALGAALFIFANACSGCYWTLLARSTLGGIVFSLGSQFALVASVYVAAEKLSGDNARLILAAIGVGGLLYAITFLILGWRKFMTCELRDSTPGQGSFQLDPLIGLISGRWLRNAQRKGVVNLLRKELGLSVSLFVITAVFVACWLLSLGALWLMPGRRDSFQIVFGVLISIYLPVMAVLSGSLSVIEEKTLGTHAWQLTLPVSSWRKWFIKLAVGLALGIVLGLLLPLLLWFITGPALGTGPQTVLENGNWKGILLFWGAGFVLSFWGATLVSTPARAALTAVLGLCGICSLVFLGTWCAEGLKGSESEFAGWLHWLRLSAFLGGLPDLLILLVFVGPALTTVLVQSLVQFPRTQTRALTLWKYSLILGLVVFLTAFLSGG